MYVYPIEFESTGGLGNSGKSFDFFSLFLFQFAMLGYLSTIFGKAMITVSVLIIGA